VRTFVQLDHRQCIHIRPQSDRRTYAAFKRSDHTCFAYLFMHGIAKIAQHRCHERRSGHFLERRFRVCVQRAAPCPHLAGDFGIHHVGVHLVARRHVQSLYALTLLD